MNCKKEGFFIYKQKKPTNSISDTKFILLYIFHFGQNDSI